jgi:hypothetical protein
MADINDESRWAVPEPPVRQLSVCSVERIQVKALPAATDAGSELSEAEREAEIEYRASIVFQIDNQSPVTYRLYTNPVFITAPPCHGTGHQVHTRELAKYQRNRWNVEDLKDASPDDYDGQGVMIVNATGKGAEAVARAWCSETGKNALIRRATGPCFVCAYNLASGKELGVNVLIWVS